MQGWRVCLSVDINTGEVEKGRGLVLDSNEGLVNLAFKKGYAFES